MVIRSPRAWPESGRHGRRATTPTDVPDDRGRMYRVALNGPCRVGWTSPAAHLRTLRQTRVMLEIDALTKRYGPVVALDGASFTAAPGRIVGFLGPNGAGKTTTMRCIFGLARQDGGTVRWAGKVGGSGGAPAVRLHARTARPVPADAGRRATQLLRPAARPARPRRRCGGASLAGPDGPGRPGEVEARGALAREPAADPAGDRPRPRPRAARHGRAVLRPRSDRDRDDDRGRARTSRRRGRRRVLQPPARPRRGRLRGRRHHRPRPGRGRRPHRDAQGRVRPAASRSGGRRFGRQLARRSRPT